MALYKFLKIFLILRDSVVERRSVFDRRTFPAMRTTYSWRVTTYVGKLSANRSANEANSAFHPFGVDRSVVKLSCN